MIRHLENAWQENSFIGVSRSNLISFLRDHIIHLGEYSLGRSTCSWDTEIRESWNLKHRLLPLNFQKSPQNLMTPRNLTSYSITRLHTIIWKYKMNEWIEITKCQHRLFLGNSSIEQIVNLKVYNLLNNCRVLIRLSETHNYHRDCEENHFLSLIISMHCTSKMMMKIDNSQNTS